MPRYNSVLFRNKNIFFFIVHDLPENMCLTGPETSSFKSISIKNSFLILFVIDQQMLKKLIKKLQKKQQHEFRCFHIFEQLPVKHRNPPIIQAINAIFLQQTMKNNETTFIRLRAKWSSSELNNSSSNERRVVAQLET